MYNTIVPSPTHFVINDQPVSFGKMTVIEGCDGTGKSTIIREIKEALSSSNKDVRVIRFPDNRKSLMFRNMIMSEDAAKHPSVEIFLFMADFVYTLQSEVMPYLDDPNVMFLFDRFIPSTCVYQDVDRATVAYILEKTQSWDLNKVLSEIDYLYIVPKTLDDLITRLASKRGEDVNRLDPKTENDSILQFGRYDKFIQAHLKECDEGTDPLNAQSVNTLRV